MLLVMVTYTHNDAQLLNGLLREVSRWSIAPSHIFVIDDASDTPYVLPLELKSLFGGSAALSAQMERANELASQANQADFALIIFISIGLLLQSAEIIFAV